jgi:Cu(I)/Ag(I) efflux system protein CusF
MKPFISALAAATFVLSASPTVFSQETKPVNGATIAASKGQVQKIDLDAGRLTIKHGELKNINMPAMTMVFDVADKAALSKLKVGDKITFVANNANGQLTASNVTVSE